jgi:GNAT superfamily N-acetyltransferase
MTPTIERRDSGAGALCAEILAELPEWFGLPESNADYAHLAETGPVWLAMDEAGRPVGLMILKSHGAALETYLLAVRRALHGGGAGRALLEAADAEARRLGIAYLTVKTRGPSALDANYERTRGFYEAVGFTALEEFIDFWGPENPCLFMVRPVGPQ